jgi:hypothetical protein
MRVESREVGFWLVAKKKSFSIFEEEGSEDRILFLMVFVTAVVVEQVLIG